MPNKHAAVKDLRKNAKRAARNNKIKTHLKALSRQLAEFLQAGKKAEATEIMKRIQQAAAKAGHGHVFHANRAARRTSSAARSLARMK